MNSPRELLEIRTILQEESNITKVVDPWGGSYMMESLTESLYLEAKKILEEVEKAGGMAKYIETGAPKLNIEKSAARRQAGIDSGKEVIVGVNKYKLQEEEEVETLEIDNHKVRNSQLDRLEKLKSDRNPSNVKSALEKLESSAKTGEEIYFNYLLKRLKQGVP